MPRPPAAPITLIQDAPLRDTELNAATKQHAALAEAYGNERDLLTELLAQAQTAGAYEGFSRTMRISKIAFIKENKLYRALHGRIFPHGCGKMHGTWEEFCLLLGRSVDQVDRDIANLAAFGEEALDSMQRIGIGYRELRTYRSLPEDDRAALAEAAKEDDKDAFLDLAETLIERHAKEKAALRADNEAKDARLAAVVQKRDAQAARIDELEVALKRAQKLTAEAAPDDVLAALQQDVSVAAIRCESLIRGPLEQAIDALAKHCDVWRNLPALHGALLQIESSLRHVGAQLGHLRDKHGIQEVDQDLIPAWAKPAADAE